MNKFFSKSNVCSFTFLTIVFLSLAIASPKVLSQSIDRDQFISKNPNAISGFIENKGQMHDIAGKSVPYVYFRTTQRNVDFLVTKHGLSYTFFSALESENKLIDDKTGRKLPQPLTYEYARTLVYLEGATIDSDKIVKENPVGDGVFNYYYSNCPQGVTGVRSFSKVTINDVYKGIDWVLYTTEKGIKYDFVIHPGADPSQIKLRYEGAADVAVSTGGDNITAKNHLGEIREGYLLAYQKESNKKVNSKFIASNNKVSFWIGDYDNNETLVIDPPISWGTYFGSAASGSGSPASIGLDITADATNVYVTGHSNDVPILSWDPQGLGAGNTTHNKGYYPAQTDIYIARFDHAGIQSWTTFFGNSAGTGATPGGLNYGWGVAIDPTNQHTVVVGQIQTSDFPLKNLGGAYYSSAYKSYNGFITEFDNNGVLYWSTFYGEPTTGEVGATTTCRAVTFDSNGNLFVGGTTLSKNLTLNNGGGVPFYKGTHSDAADALIDRQLDAFILKFNSSRAMVWGTLWGGAETEALNSLAVDDNNNLLVIGSTGSTDLASGGQLNNPGGTSYYDGSNSYVDAYVLKFNTSLQLSWGTLFGDETGEELGYDIAADRNHNIYIVGSTYGGSSFPKLDMGSGAYYQSAPASNGYRDGFIARFNSSGVQQWGTFYGGGGSSASTADDYLYGVTTNNNNQVYVYGITASTTFPTYKAYQSSNASAGATHDDFCLVGFTSAGVRKFSTYVGGNGTELGYANAMTMYKGHECFYFTGASASTNAPTVNPGGGAYYQSAKATGASNQTMIYRYCPELSGSVTATTNVGCNGASTGQATVSAFDGGGGYTYSWNPSGQTTATATGLGANTYTVTITDALSATSTVTIVITQPSAISATTSFNEPSCNGDSDGDASVSASGGTTAYTYSWSAGGQTTATATGLSASTYTVLITDANSCTATKTVVVTQPAVLTATAGSTTNVNCFGGSTGASTVTAGGGTAPYSYSWSTTPSKSTASATGLAASTYTIKVTDNYGCTKTTTVQITQPAAALAASVSSSTNVACNGASTGDATVTASDGTAGYTYSWSTTPSQTAATATGLSATTYTVKVTDANSCTKTATITITQPTTLTASVSSSTNVDCFGNNNGAATVSASNGAGSYSYSWSAGGQTTATATGLTGTSTYTVTVTDANFCTKTTTVQITQPAAALGASVSSSTNVLCFGNNTGAATVTASNGTAVYSYSWSAGAQTTATATGLTGTATYTVTVTDANLCTKTATVQITQPAAALNASISSSTDVGCNGASTGQATVSATDGTAGYTYSWSTTPSQTAVTATGLSATTYTVKVTDVNACTKTVSITLTQPAVALSATISSSTNVACFGDNTGAATVNASNGTAAYSYSWSAGGQTSATATGLTGTAIYTVTVTDANLCTKTATIQITQPAVALGASVSSSTNVLCFGNNTGAATVLASNGTAGYTYSWSAGGQTAATATGLTGTSTYTVTVTDANLCTKTATVQITQPAAALDATISSSTNVACFGNNTGAATVTATDGTFAYTYSWSAGAQTTATATGLTGTATYTVTVTDANLCTKTATIQITQPAAGLTAVVSSSTNVNCFGDNTGAATVSAADGTAGYTYSWSAGGQTTATATGLTGTAAYTVTVTDANLCTKTATIQITQPAAALGATISSSTNVDCFGNSNGAATVTASNGTVAYSYSWSAGGQTSATATGLTGTATYTVIVTDANLCTKSVTVQITQPAAALDATISSSANVNCFGDNTGTATVTATDGTSAYTYSWSAGAQTSATATGLTGTATYTVLVTDANLCTKTATVQITQPAIGLTAAITSSTNVDCKNNTNGDATVTAYDGTAGYTYSWSTSPSQNTITATGLGAGSYTVVVTDANLCTTSVSVNITQPAGILAGLIDSKTNVSCFGDNTGLAILIPTGGTPSYNYSWSTTPVQTTAIATGLGAATYTVTITDQHNCSATITTVITQPAAPLNALASQTTSVDCYGNNTGEASVAVTGGTTGYMYSWSNGVTGNSATSISNVAAGVYTVTVMDSHACTTSATVDVTQPSAALASAISTNSNVLCFGGNTGSATASASGGTTNYTYSWSNGTLTDVNSNLQQGTYIVTVTDNRGCTASKSVVITEPTVLVFSSPTISDAHCGQTDGGASINISGGVSAYNYLWSNGSTTNTINNVGNGAYSVQVTDANGCTLSLPITISNLDGPSIAVQGSVTNVLCHGDLSGAATVAGSGGTSPYAYSWNNGTTTATASNLAGGVTYTVTITDATTCTNQISVVITQPVAALNASVTNVNNVNCYGNSTGSITANVTGGTTNYSYSWNNGSTTLSLTNVISGGYTLTVTDANNCSSTVTASITQPQDSLDLKLTAFSDISCFGGADGWIKTTPSGGTTAYTYSWVGTNSYSSTAPDSIGGLKAGLYTLTITDAGGCTKSIVKALKNPPPMDGGNVLVTQKIDCKGYFGQASVGGLSQIGGTSPYTYNWSNGDTSIVADSLTAGAYQVTVVDAKGCTKLLSVTLTEPDSLKATAGKLSDIGCYGGVSAANVNVTGGTTSYNYSWSNSQTTSAITNIPAGNYVVTVTDANNCSTTSAVLITQPTDSLRIGTDSLFNVKCKGDLTGYASVHAFEGTGPYTYLWSNNDTDSVISGVAGGIYTVVVTDANGCSRSKAITITQPANSISVNIVDGSQVFCYGESTGSIIVSANGTPPYMYSWSNGQNGTNGMASGLVAGSYTVTVTDKNNCTASVSNVINQPSAPLNVVLSSIGVPCYGGITNVNATVSGGTSAYTYTWNTSATQQSISGVYAGNYSITVHDQYGCTATANLNITQPSNSLSVTASTLSDNNCYGDANGAANVTTQGGTPSYTYTWNTGATTASLSNLTAGEYIVTVVDSNKCSGTDTVYVLQPAAPLDVTLSVTDPNCWYSADAGIVTNVTGGTTAYSYSWSNNATTGSLSGIVAGTYTLQVTDSKGCTVVKSATVSSPTNPAHASFTTDITSGVAPITVNFTNTSSGGISDYVWNFGDSSPVEHNLNATHTYSNGGEYHVTLIVVNDKGCSDTADVYIYPYNIPNVFTPNGDGKNDTFFVINEGMEDITCQIYDRWGLLIYEYSGIHGYWDGRTLSGSLATDGTYYYLVNIKVKDGKEHKHQGYIQLIR